MNEAEFVDLVEQHRQEQLMGLPPVDLLTRARRTRALRRRRTAAIPGVVLVAAALVVGAVHTFGQLIGSSAGASPPGLTHPAAPPTTSPATRLVGLNGWVVSVPASWGTDQIGCDSSSSIRPSVLFDHHVEPLPPARPCPRPRATTPFLRIAEERFHGVPWRTISGVEVDRRRHAACPGCATLRVPTAGVSFEIQASSTRSLRRIEESLHPISSRQVTVPVWTAPATGQSALDQMTVIATGVGLRSRVLEVPSRRPPGTFLRSDPPLGTPVDLGRYVALYFSAGDLGRYATGGSLARHGWRIFPVSSDQPSYARSQAIRAAGVPHPAGHPAFLRTLTIIHEGPRLVVVRRRLTWLVVTAHRDGTVAVTAVDAATDRVLESQSGFRGRRS
jgi:hypothetical protein